ncbi:MAG: amidohydrolase family protein [Balneolaceae bacterium]|nr:amidohydrolase family protein [Balneolaceae bacterium]
MLKQTEELYRGIDKIDAHIHQNSRRTALLEEAEKEGFQLVTINTEVPDFPAIDEQREIALACNQKKTGILNFMATFSANGWGEPDWQVKALAQIQTGINHGAVSVKIWKNFGMELRDSNGDFVMADHPSLNTIYETLEKNGITLIAHIGEPKNCWLPIEEMTVNGDRDYFSKNPRYHMYLHKEYPSYEEHLQARDRVLKKFRNLRFVGAHLASHEWSVDKVAEWLDTFPGAGVDLAERVCHLQYQAVENQPKVKAFMEKYQDRIIYGTDQIDDGSLDAAELRATIRKKWHEEFQFFAEESTQTSKQVDKPFKGLGLDKSVLTKIFCSNALKYYPKIDN